MIVSRPLSVARVALAALVLSAGTIRAQAPTMVLLNGRIFTGDSTRPWAEALAIRGERIVAVGTTADIRRLAGAKTRRFDLTGRVAIPGINDAHDHLADLRPGWFRTSDSPTPDPTLPQIIDSLRSLSSRARPGTWLTSQIGMAMIANPAARRATLDSVSGGHPVALFTWWGHPTLLNSAALAALHISDTTRDPLGGWYERDAAGRLTGRADEYAKMPFDRYLGSMVRPDSIIAGLRAFAEDELRQGVTSVQDMSTGLEPSLTARVFRDARLPLRTRIIPVPIPNARGRNEIEWDTLPRRLNATTTISGRKWILDGTPIEQDALRRALYPGTQSRGRSNFPIDTLRAMLAGALRANAPQLHLHIVGDSTTAIVLNQMSQLAPDSVWRRKRVRFEHGNGLVGADLDRAVRMGIVIAQPRAETAPFRSWLAARIPIAYGSDGLRNPYVHMLNAVTKSGGDTTQRVSREEWVTIMTHGPAFAERAEAEKGILRPGMLADIAVLSQDIFTIPVRALPATRSVLTIVGGRVVFEARE